MKTVYIILTLFLFGAASAHSQTLKALSYNTTNGQVVYSGTNTLSMPDQVKFGTNGAGVASGGSTFNLLDGAGGVSITLGTNSIFVFDKISFSGSPSNAIANAAATRTNLGLGSAATNDAAAFQPASANLTNLASNNGSGLTNIPSTNIVDSTSIGRSLLTAATAAAGRTALGGTSFGGAIFAGTSANAKPTLIASILGFSVTNNLGFDSSLTNLWTATNAASAATAIGLGSTNNVTFSNVTVNGTFVFASPSVPAATTNTGLKGQLAYTNNYLYICISNNTWMRVLLETW